METERLTEEQRSFAERHYGLIFAFMTKYGYDPQEYYGDAAIGLCQAVLHFRPELGSFSTFAYNCMHHQCLKQIQEKNKSSFDTVSWEDALYDDSALHLSDAVSSGEDAYASAEGAAILLGKMKERLALRELQVVLLRLQGKTQKEIAAILGCSGQNVSLVMKEIKKAMSDSFRPTRKKMGDEALRGVLLQRIAETVS